MHCDNKNGIAVHANETHHTIKWDEAEIIDQEQNWYKRRFKEALHIGQETQPMNLDCGLQINHIWNTIT